MLVPFGTHVRDKDGKSIGTVSRLVLHPDSRQVVALVIRQGVLDRREVVVPIRMVERSGDEVRVTLRARELDGLDLFGTPALRPMPDQWPMPMGFDLRSFFLVAADGWMEATLPFVLTSPAVSGTPAFIPDPAAPARVKEPAIAAATPVVDHAGRRVGEVSGMELEPTSGRITRVLVREGMLFRRETAIPASLIASVGDRITLTVSADEVKKLEPPYVGEPGTAPVR